MAVEAAVVHVELVLAHRAASSACHAVVACQDMAVHLVRASCLVAFVLGASLAADLPDSLGAASVVVVRAFARLASFRAVAPDTACLGLVQVLQGTLEELAAFEGQWAFRLGAGSSRGIVGSAAFFLYPTLPKLT